jgi:2,4'-dihydroxyacetophenone dioxygenase
MTATDAPISAIPSAVHRGFDELPMIEVGGGVHIQVLQANVDQGFWVVRNHFEPGTTIERHKHTGPVYAFTLAGSWKYLEYPEINTAGSYLYEPAGSVHTLHVPETNTEMTDVWFTIFGANLNLDDDDNITSVYDAQFIRDAYYLLCEAQGLPRPNVIT